MLQSLHRGQAIIMQSLQSSGLPSIMSTNEFLTHVAWLGVQPSPSGGGGTSAAQEPEQAIEELVLAEDELIPLEPFSFAADISMAQEEETSPDPMPEPFPAPISEGTMPLALAMEPE